MKKILYLLVTLSLFLSILGAQQAAAQTATNPEDNSGAVVCPPGVYLQAPADCLALGPSEYLTQMARLGITFPLKPLAYTKPDPALKDLPYKYYWADSATGVHIYPSQSDALAGQGAVQTIAPGKLLYVAYSQYLDTGKGKVFLLPSGEWMAPEGMNSTRVSLLEYQPGVEFSTTPANAFGWILEPDTSILSQPNLLNDNKPTGKLGLYEVVQVYSFQNIEGLNWAMIGPNQWVDGRSIAVVFPDATPPDGVTNGRWIDVNLAQQTISVYDNQRLVFATVMASGLGPNWTRPGLFQIYQKKEAETMSGDQGTPDYYYLEDVPWTMYFDKARALHGAYWRARLGFPQSHGCVNLTVGDAHWLFNWASVGDWVYVHDPSGVTPSDPSMYSDGGA